MKSALLRLLRRRWLWALLIFLAISCSSILCLAYLGTAWANERTLVWMDVAQQKGLSLGMSKICPLVAARRYPVLRRFLERPVLYTWFDTVDQVKAFDSLPPCPVQLSIYPGSGADQAVRDAVSVRQQKANSK
jgi:hypothetical protein